MRKGKGYLEKMLNRENEQNANIEVNPVECVAKEMREKLKGGIARVVGEL